MNEYVKALEWAKQALVEKREYFICVALMGYAKINYGECYIPVTDEISDNLQSYIDSIVQDDVGNTWGDVMYVRNGVYPTHEEARIDRIKCVDELIEIYKELI